jgi:5-methylcytosine-specific restriction endonuclease McrA
MRRKSTGKRLRFEVFKRDHFTCQYCGAQPPEIVLVADHIVAVAAGGETTIENLITACEPCNQGKAAKELGQRAIRPDADLLYLETQQEIAELRRFQQAKTERDAEIARVQPRDRRGGDP